MTRKIVDHLQDRNGNWKRILDCGHLKSLKPNTEVSEKLSSQTSSFLNREIGNDIDCTSCEKLGLEVSNLILKNIELVLKEAWEEGGIAGLCSEGRFDLVVDYLNTIDIRHLRKIL